MIKQRLKISEIILNINKKIIMPKSRNRKNHKQKVLNRSKRNKEMESQYRRLYQDVLLKQIESIKSKYETTSGETIENEVNG